MPDGSLHSSSKVTNSASSFGLTGKSRHVYLSGAESRLRMKPVGGSSLNSGKEPLPPRIGQKQLQPSFQQPYVRCNQSESQQEGLYSQPQCLGARSVIWGFDQCESTLNDSRDVKIQNPSCNRFGPLELQPKEQCQQQHISLENRKSGMSLSPRISEGYSLDNDYTRQNQVSMKSRIVYNNSQQFQPLTGSAERNQCSTSDSCAPSDRFQKPRDDERYGKYHKFRLLYLHALGCIDRERRCEMVECMDVKRLLDHISHCSGSCSLKSCSSYKNLLTHYQECSVNNCNICGPDKMKQGNNLLVISKSSTGESMANSPRAIDAMEVEQPFSKRSKTEDPFLSCKGQNEESHVLVPDKNVIHSAPEGDTVECQELSNSINNTPESIELGSGPSSSPSQESPAENYEAKIGDQVNDTKIKHHVENSTSFNLADAQPMEDSVQVPLKGDKVNLEDNCTNAARSDAQMTETKPRKLRKGVSLIDSFTEDQIKEHINSLKLLETQVSMVYVTRVNYYLLMLFRYN